MLNLRKKTIDYLKKSAIEAYPNEAVGIIDGKGKVHVLKNTSESPHNSFEVSRDQIAQLFKGREAQSIEQATLWHSHPSGLVGPSRVDMQNKTKFNYHLVVTIDEDDVILTWY